MSSNTLSLAQKYTVLHSNTTSFKRAANLAIQFNVELTEILETANSRTSVMDLIDSKHYKAARKYPMGGSKHPIMENILYSWLLEQQQMERILTKQAVKLKAQEIFVTLNERGKTFGATPSWLKNFCQRCNVRGLVSMEGSNRRR